MSSPPPIRSKILKILLVPTLALVALWLFMAYSTVAEVSALSQTLNRWGAIGAPTRELATELQRERRLTAEAAGRTAQDKALADQRRATDGKVEVVREVIASAAANEPGNALADVRALESAMDGLDALRVSADNGSMSAIQLTDAYNASVFAATRQFGSPTTLPDVASFRTVRGVGAYTNTAEYLGREQAILAPVLKRGEMTQAEHAAFVAAMTSRRNFQTNADRDMSPELLARYQQVAGDAPHQRLQAAENTIFAWDLKGRPPLDPASWKRDSQTVLDTIARQTQEELVRASAMGEKLKRDALLRIAVVIGVGLIAVIASILISYRFGRSMIAELRRLQDSAVELAEERLPRLVERLRRGEDVDPASEAPELAPADTAEVDRVVQAFSSVRRTAVEAAVGQATLRKGVGQVFLNLAWRNQALLHRQLNLLDAMERRVEEPEILEDLFKLDHLTTRMRRHAENLIILSDAVPARRWRDPVPIFDVVRSAVLEVEDYTRVTVLPMPHAPMLVGGVVTDLIHLIAELVENATVFSPPNTVVHVRSMSAAKGFALEIEDRGLGLNRATLDELNAKLAEPPEFDLADSDRLGLFVVARLASRHGIKVVLRPSPYDGTTAIVLLPPALLAVEEVPVFEVPQRSRHGAHAAGQTRAPNVPAATPPRELTGVPEWQPEPPREWQPDPPREWQPVPEPATEWQPAPEPATDWFPAQERQEQPPPVLPTRRAVAVPETDDDLDGLPVRVRQANLAPQLRQARSSAQRDVSTRTPEELSNLMSSMQRGWQQGRGRTEQDQDVWNRKESRPDARPQI
ncbi:nitrate- and nitrite sensing domain-containing protein [Streptosporangium sp. NPDC023615]|uniref:nitrate- and nitrite sensing domain-containing protein n=1 Tax=Streptosporangium sp. NPDC023615 TaxID=3154794 RepID=UPI0034140389